jgi:DNA-binding HxlR family transcriptional regulator
MLRTTSQEKQIASLCPIAKAAHLVGDTVVLLIVRDLFGGPKRFKDLSESLEGVSSRTLTLKLKALEKLEIITRKEFAERPPKVEYSLTKKGKGLQKVISALEGYGRTFLQ